MSQRKIDLVDPKTGETHQGVLVWVPERPKIGGFFMGFQDAFKMLARDTELTPQAQRVLLYLLGELDFENYIHIKQKDLGDALDIGKSNISRAITLLKRKEILLEAPYKGVKCYKLNHFYGWKGRVVSLREEREKRFTVIEGGKSADDSPAIPPT